jgi:phage regulator Rha-like protein
MIPIIQDSVLTMTSKEIADLTEKSHGHVKRDIIQTLKEAGIDASIFGYTYIDGSNREQSAFKLPKRECDLVVSGYSVKYRLAIIDRWQELEEKNKKHQLVMPDFSNPAEAARAWAAQYESAQLAIATKAEIGSRREATAMNTASQAVKQANKLEIELDKSKSYSSVKRMEMLYHGQKFNWRELKSTCALMGLEPIDIFDANYGTVKAWPAEVWREVYALEII